jgi:uncharacterized membrane protein
MADQTSGAQGSGGGSGLQPNVASLLCYLCGWVTGLIFLLIEKDNKEVKFHAWNSIAISVVATVIFFGLYIIQLIFLSISFGLARMFGIIIYLVDFGFFGLFIFLMVKAYQGERVKLPVVGDFAEKQAAK